MADPADGGYERIAVERRHDLLFFVVHRSSDCHPRLVDVERVPHDVARLE